MKRLLLIFIMMAPWIVVSCTHRLDHNGCYGYWEYNQWGMKRGTISWKNADYKRPYRQCVEKESPHRNLEKRPYG